MRYCEKCKKTVLRQVKSIENLNEEMDEEDIVLQHILKFHPDEVQGKDSIIEFEEKYITEM